MKQNTRILAGIAAILVIVLAVVGIDQLQRNSAVLPESIQAPGTSAVTLAAGSVPVYLDGQLIAGFSPTDLNQMEKASFVEPAEGVTQEGWRLRDVLLLYLPPDQLAPNTQVVVSSSSRSKSAQLTWAEIEDDDNMVMFDLANRGTLKLVSKMEKLDTRDEWVQDVDKIEVNP